MKERVKNEIKKIMLFKFNFNESQFDYWWEEYIRFDMGKWTTIIFLEMDETDIDSYFFGAKLIKDYQLLLGEHYKGLLSWLEVKYINEIGIFSPADSTNEKRKLLILWAPIWVRYVKAYFKYVDENNGGYWAWGLLRDFILIGNKNYYLYNQQSKNKWGLVEHINLPRIVFLNKKGYGNVDKNVIWDWSAPYLRQQKIKSIKNKLKENGKI